MNRTSRSGRQGRKNFSYNINLIKKSIGSNSDLIDVNAEYDKTLSYSENKNIILKKAKRKGLISNKNYKDSSVLILKAESINNKRNPKVLAEDNKKTALKTYDNRTLTLNQLNKWKKNKDRIDIRTIDSKGYYIKPFKEKKRSSKQIKKDIDEIELI